MSFVWGKNIYIHIFINAGKISTVVYKKLVPRIDSKARSMGEMEDLHLTTNLS